MSELTQGIITGIFSAIGFFVVEIYIKPYMEKKRINEFRDRVKKIGLKDKIIKAYKTLID